MQHDKRVWGEGGFTLVEVLVAAGLLATVAAGASYMVVRAVEDAAQSRTRTVAALLAAQKMEQLRSLAWCEHGDATTDLSGEAPAGGGPGLLASPAGTLDSDVPSYVDYATGDGRWLAATDAALAVFARRWAVTPHADDANMLVLHVVVTAARGPSSRTAGVRGYLDVELVSLRARCQP